MRTFKPVTLGLLLVVSSLAARDTRAAATATAGRFRLVLDESVQSEPYSGRVYVVFGKQDPGHPGAEPRLALQSWFDGAQVLAQDVSAVAPGAAIAIDRTALGYPHALPDVAPGSYVVQAVARKSLDSPNPGRGKGDLVSEPIALEFAPGDEHALELRLTRAIGETPFEEDARTRLFEMPSPSLSKFYGRPITLRAGVLLPEGWRDDASASYPTLYFITGFGGSHRNVRILTRLGQGTETAARTLMIVPDPTCPLGHCVFADSENNGPRGKALIEELIPAIERRFHGAQSGTRRYVTGISSGGWSALWLAITYPDVFAGCWSHCPDPVDFRDFQRIDLYAPGTNMYRDEQGGRRPLARDDGKVVLWYDDFVRQETVVGPGGQIHSFEAVFSARGADGAPVPLFDRKSGAVDTQVAKSWEKYDIRLVLERGWPTLSPKLAGKLHVYAGEQDTFYLEGAARLLKESLAKLESDAEVVIVPGMPHTIHPQGLQAMWSAIGKRD